VSRRVLFVSTDAAATVTVPLTAPSAQTVPFPLTSRKTPFTAIRPHMRLLFSPIPDLTGSRTHSPARFPPVSRAGTGGAGVCPDGVRILASSSVPR
jgi:hypothetical protein